MVHSSSSAESSETSMEESRESSVQSSLCDVKEDRLSNLPDCIILNILSSLNTKQVVHICILSKRWRNCWKQLQTLTLNPLNFDSFNFFTIFVSRILSLLEASTSLNTLKLYSLMPLNHSLFERILKYAASRNVQKLKIVARWDIHLFPSYFFSCYTSLTSLHLGYVSFRGGTDPFSAFPKLSTLKICHFNILGEQNIFISSETLLNLTIQSYSVNHKIKLCTPSLSTFSLMGDTFEILHGSHLSSVEQVKIELDINVSRLRGRILVKLPLDLLNWLQELTNIKSLTVSSNTLEIISVVLHLLKVEFPYLCNLKLLKVEEKKQEVFKETSSSIPNGIIDFLLQNSPSAVIRFIK